MRASTSVGPDTASAPYFGRRFILKNAVAVVLLLGVWLALDTGYFTPDRPTRAQWERLEKAKRGTGGQPHYQSNFSTISPGETSNPAGNWGMYNGATVSTVRYDPAGVTIDYNGVPWIGAAFRLNQYEAQRIYRVTLERDVQGEPGALIVRNRQMDLMRTQVPVGKGPMSSVFIAPRGSRDQITFAFIPDNPGAPQGSLRITSLKIERLED